MNFIGGKSRGVNEGSSKERDDEILFNANACSLYIEEFFRVIVEEEKRAAAL